MMGVIMSSYVVMAISSGCEGENLFDEGFGVGPFTLAVMCVPVFDAMRVMIMRVIRKTSPFYPDKTHLHHLFIELGFSHFGTKVVIDASGDGDVAYKSGAEYFKGRESDGKMQPATLMFKVGGVDTERAVFPGSFETLVPTERGELQALAREKLPHPAGHVLLYKSTLPGIVTCNMTNVIDVDGTSAQDLTKAELITRKQMPLIVDFLREYVPGYENCYVIGSASLMGVRETRHFKGVKMLTEQEISDAVQHDDYVVYDAHFNFDVHNITGAGLDATGCQHNFKQKNGYTIPYGCMVPEKIDGLLLSGRNISGTHMAHSNFRVMPICIGIGEACGAAAAIAAKSGREPREIDAAEIRTIIGEKNG